ncbi:hypothetical protein pb186bvf_004497 [Paramecium bursaria]
MLTNTAILQYNLIQEFTSQFKQPSKELFEQRESENLNLLVNEKIIQIPVRTKNCKGHNQWSFDLLDIYTQSANKESECGICKEKFTQNDLVLDHYYYSFIRQFNKKCQYIVILKDMCYQKVFRQIKYTKQLDDHKKLIYSLYERKDEQNNFSKIFKQDGNLNQQLIEFQYQAVCLQDQVKLYLPVRFKECKHIGAYELSSLLCHFKEVVGLQEKAVKDKQVDQNQQQEYQKLQINKIYQCRQPGCKVKINYDINELEQNLVLDYELLQAIKLAHPSTINFQVKNNLGVIKFDDEFTNLKDQFIKNLWDQMPKQTQNLYPSPITDKIKVTNSFGEFFSSILDTFQRIFSNQDEQKVLKAFLLSFKYQTHNISLFDKIANRIIEYPARCIECKDRSKCLDLRTLLSILYNQKRSEPDKKGIQCPICSFNHQPGKPRNSIPINNTLYIDNQLLAQMIKDNSYQKLDNNVLQYDGKKIMLEEYIRNQVITIEQSREQSQVTNGIFQYQSMKCNGTDTLLKDPLLLVKCPTQNRFSFDYVYEAFKKSGFKSNELKLCKCAVCNQSTQDIQDLYYDEFLAHIIPQLPKNYNINEPIKYDTQKGEFILELEKQVINQDIKPVINYLKGENKGFFDMKDDLEYQELFKPKVHNNYQMQVNQRSTMIGGIKVTETADGRTIEGQDQKLKTMNEIAQQEQFAKWGLQVSNIQVKFTKKK